MPYLIDLFLFFGRPLKFANSQSVYKEDEPLVGTFPEHLIDLEVDFLRNIHDNCQELNDIQFKAKNAMSKYMRTRTQPSSESVRRVKGGILEESMAAAPHPILGAVESSDEAVRFQLLQDLRNFKPSTTIFELHTATKKAQAEVMREKRRQHQHYIERKAVTLAEKKEAKEKDAEVEKSASAAEAATTEDVESTFSKVITGRKFDNMVQSDAMAEAKKQRKRRLVDQREKEKAEHYIAYAPADAYSEAGLAVDRGFIDAAKSAAVDISGDDDKSLYKAQHKKVWDRKTKKFIGQSGDDPAKKRIRTEDGTWLPASYKSGRYETWQQQQKTHYKHDDGEDDGESGNANKTPLGSRYRPGQKKFGFKKKSRGRGNHEGGQQKQAPKNELKSKDAMFKERKKKAKVMEFQNQRRIANAKKRPAQKK
uniref:RNA helicase n=1 Tax=Steinernema glaseri TaxID=37863 RepID=A0A1I7Z817_9BILA